MTPDEFRDYLRNLQKSPYGWPNDYFAWEKPDKSLLMVGIASTQMYELLVHEQNPAADFNKRRAEFGLPAEYSSVLYGISPHCTYMQGSLNGPAVRYDPVEKLVDKVAGCRFLGSWRDPDVLMDAPYAFSKVLACGRWELAKAHILQQEKKLPLSEQISQANGKAAEQAQNSPDRLAQNRGSETISQDGRD